MKHIKKTILGIMVTTLVMGILSLGTLTLKETNAVEYEEIKSGDWCYRLLEDGTAELTAYYGEKVDVVIPAEVDGKKVTEIGGGIFYGCTLLESIKIPDSVIEIGDEAFWGCESLKSINLPKNITKIASYTFAECKLLNNVIIPEKVSEIKEGAFWGCRLLENLIVPESIEEIESAAFVNCPRLKNVYIPAQNNIYIEDNAFGHLIDFDLVTLEGSLEETKISDFTLKGYCGTYSEAYARQNGFNFIAINELQYKVKEDATICITDCNKKCYTKEIIIPETIDGKCITEIGYGAFSHCELLESIIIPDGVTSIGGAAFEGCTKLKNIEIPKSVNNISSYSVQDTQWFKDRQNENPLVIVNGILIDGKTAEGNVIIPDDVVEINEYAFYFNDAIESLFISDSVNLIGRDAFFWCDNLKTISGGSGVKILGEGAFSCTEWIRTQKKIKKDGLWYCKFNDFQILCEHPSDIGEIKIAESTIETSWSYGKIRHYVELPDGTIMLAPSGIYDLSPIDGKPISIISTGTYDISDGMNGYAVDEELVIAEGVEVIGSFAFYDQHNIISLKCPTTLKQIGDRAFSFQPGDDCVRKLSSITLNEGLIKIGEEAFFKQLELKSVVIPSSVEEIGEYAFGYYGIFSERKKVPGFTIYGYPNTAAEAYAKENGFKFISMENEKTDSLISIVSSGDFSPKLEMSKDELLSAVAGCISAEQLSSVEAGKTPLDLRIMVKAIDDSVSGDDKSLIAQALTELPDSAKLNYKVLKYLDIKLSAVIDGKELAVPETDGEVTVSVALEKPANENYKIVRIHDGKAEIIDARLDNEGKRLTFRTDKFSTYAVIYSDLASGGDAPKTLIAAFMLAGAAVMAAGAVVMIKAFRASEG